MSRLTDPHPNWSLRIDFAADPGRRLAVSGGNRWEKAGLVVAGVVRLDNARELLRQLALPRATPPLAVVGHATRAWGDAFPSRVFGGFACALYDPCHRVLLLARDLLGIRQ